VAVEETIKASVVKPNQAIKLRARKECTDRDGNQRVTGEEWLVKKTGAYLPGAYEEVVDVVNAYVLTEKVRECEMYRTPLFVPFCALTLNVLRRMYCMPRPVMLSHSSGRRA